MQLDKMNKTVILTLAEFQKFCAQDLSYIALDFETTSLSYLELEINGWSICNGKSACYVDYADNPEQNELLDLLKDVLKDKVQFLSAHGVVYELKVMHKYGIQHTDNIYCSLVGAKLLNENRGKNEYGLKSLVRTELGVPEDEILTWAQANKFGIHSEEFRQYGMKDAIWCWQLTEKEIPELKAQDLWYVWNSVERGFQFVLADLEMNGVLIDVNKLYKFKPEVENILFQLEVLMLAEIGMEHDVCEVNGIPEPISPINFSSSQQLVQVAEQILGLKITERTKRSKKHPKGQQSVDKFTIARLKPKSEFFNLLSRYRKLGTLHRTFLAPCESFIGLDGRIRATYQMIRTGRLSCSRPNLQNLPNPKKEKLEFNHRELFISKPGFVFVKADWAGQELRVLAEESQDACMIQAFIDEKDLHLMTANSIFNLKLTDEQLTATSEAFKKAKKEFATERHRAKNGVNFPIIYGKSVQTLATDFNIPVEEAQRWMDAFHGLYPNVKKAIYITKLELQEQHYVITMMGRKRRFPGYNQMSKWEKAAALRQAFNFKIQGFSADMMKMAGGRIRLILHNYVAQVVLTIHDEFIYEVREDQAAVFAAEIKHIMEHVVCLSIPIVVDVSIVKSYGD